VVFFILAISASKTAAQICSRSKIFSARSVTTRLVKGALAGSTVAAAYVRLRGKSERWPAATLW